MKRLFLILVILFTVCLIQKAECQNTKGYDFFGYNFSVKNVGDTSKSITIQEWNEKYHYYGDILILSENDIERFANDLEKVYIKVYDWYRKAKENNIDTLFRQIPINFGEYKISYGFDSYVIKPTIHFAFVHQGGFINSKTIIVFQIPEIQEDVRFVMSFEENDYFNNKTENLNELKNLVLFLKGENINRIVNELREQNIQKERQEELKKVLFN